MVTERELLWRNPGSHEWSALPLPLNLGIPTALVADPNGGLWIGGTLGLAQAEIARSFIRVHTVPFEIPGAVRDVTADRDYVWAATDSGLMRIR
jgi:ligand-binding sensor domain-containing protein